MTYFPPMKNYKTIQKLLSDGFGSRPTEWSIIPDVFPKIAVLDIFHNKKDLSSVDGFIPAMEIYKEIPALAVNSC